MASSFYKTWGGSPINQQIQIEQGKYYLDVAIQYSKDINIKTTQGLAYFFDYAVHFGYLRKWNEIKTRVNNSGNIDEKQKLAIVQQFVRRHYAHGDLIIKGSGTVYGKSYDISKYKGLSYSDFWR